MIWQYFDFYTSFNKLQKSCYIIGWKKSRRSRFCCASSIYWFVGILPVSCASVALGHLAWKVVFLSFSKNICSLQLESWLFKYKSRKDWAPVCCCWDDYHHNTHTQPHFWLHWQFYSRAFPPLGSMKRKSEAKAKAAAPWCLLFLSLNQSRKILLVCLFVCLIWVWFLLRAVWWKVRASQSSSSLILIILKFKSIKQT